MRIAIISDIHGASKPLAAALSAARHQGFDQLVILGDLLTYGAQPIETLELVRDAVARDDAVLVRGNHDQIYLDRASGTPSYEATIPAWIRESVDWTCEQLAGHAGLETFSWCDEWSHAGLLAAHANPFRSSDWTYLRTPEAMRQAAETLTRRGFAAGVFGHTHRFRSLIGDGPAIYTLGSLGQPRDEQRSAEWTMVHWMNGEARVCRHALDVDWGALVGAIRATGLSAETKDRICRYYA